MQEDEAGLVDARKRQHAKIDTEGADGKVRIVRALIGRAENADELPGEELHQNERRKAHKRLPGKKLCKKRLHARFQPGSHVEAHNRDTARRHADDDGNDDLEKLHHDSDDCHWDLRILRLRKNLIQRAVFAEHVVDRSHCRNEGDLREKARYAEPQRPAANRAIQPEILLGEIYDLHVTQIPHRECRRDGLPDDGRDGGSHHAPAEAEDKDKIQNDVRQRAGERRDHRKARTAVGADDGVHRLTEHVKRDTDGDIEEIFL